MKIISEKNLRDFDAWYGAKKTKKLILDTGKEEEFEELIEEKYPDGITDTKLNLMLWYDADWILRALGIEEEEEEEE